MFPFACVPLQPGRSPADGAGGDRHAERLLSSGTEAILPRCWIDHPQHQPV